MSQQVTLNSMNEKMKKMDLVIGYLVNENSELRKKIEYFEKRLQTTNNNNNDDDCLNENDPIDKIVGFD